MNETEQCEWHDVGTAADFPAEEGRPVEIGARRIGVFNHRGELHAIKDTCPHAGVDLHDGFLREGTVTCPAHGWTFDLTTGEGPCESAVRVYPVKVEGDRVLIGV